MNFDTHPNAILVNHVVGYQVELHLSEEHGVLYAKCVLRTRIGSTPVCTAQLESQYMEDCPEIKVV